MSYLLDQLYVLAVILLSPWLIYKTWTTGKYRRGIWNKLFGTSCLTTPPSRHRVAWFHGVSVGEIHLLRSVVAGFRERHSDWKWVISTTTDTGFDEACKRFPDVPVFFWPFDFSWAVRRTLRTINPSLVVLAEGELWPNFLIAAKERGVAVAVINGRVSPRSLRRYTKLGRLVRFLWRRIDLVAAQNEEYARGYRALGARPERVYVTGSVKYDGIVLDRGNAHTLELRRLLGVQKSDLIWIAGSTQAPEEEMALSIFARLKKKHPHLRLFLVPRQKERFAEVAASLQRSGERFVRRSDLTTPLVDPSAVVLMDTIGELGALWGLADLAFVGGSLDGRRGGQNMIEPAGYGAAIVFGPHVWNFRDTAARLVQAGAAIQIPDALSLESTLERLLRDPRERGRLGTAAQAFVRSQQGATERTLDCLDRLLESAAERRGQSVPLEPPESMGLGKNGAVCGSSGRR
jgi:3-deoxy-D-manno-octulosonic-acid transferase